MKKLFSNVLLAGSITFTVWIIWVIVAAVNKPASDLGPQQNSRSVSGDTVSGQPQPGDTVSGDSAAGDLQPGSPSTGSPGSKSVNVSGYYDKNGRYVPPHTRSSPRR